MRFTFTNGAFAALVVGLGVTSSHAGEMPQVSAATGESAAAPAAATATLPPPSARVGRISLVLGKVEFRGPGDARWSAASVNDPVATGVALRTDPQSRAEIRVGADTIDLAEGTEIAVARLDQPMAEIAVKQGRIDLDIRRLIPGESIQLDVSRGGVWLLDQGRYDVDAGGGNHPTRVTAFTGDARFVGSGSDLPIASGYQVQLSGERPMKAEIAATIGDDDFASWCKARSVDDLTLAAPYFVSREMTGYAALDAAGDWRSTDKYGEVWVPKALPADWAPYRDGHWRWLAPWGWSWVDDQPWGFATSHFGRWLFADGHWVWVPGGLTADPVWAPAVVDFLGTPGVGLSYADGPGPAIAWFPLAPDEVYWPSYTRDIDYIRSINRGSVADLGAIYFGANGEPPAKVTNGQFANRGFASVVPRAVFVGGEAIETALLTIPDRRLRNAPAIMGSPKIGAPPPVPVRVAAASSRTPQSAPQVTTARSTKTAAWDSIVRAAAIRSRNFQEAARARFTHLRVFGAAELTHLRHSIVLRVARADHAASEARRRIIRR